MNGHGEHESHAGITAEIRARAGAWMDDKLKQYDERLADRLEAAHKREVDMLAHLVEDLRSQRDMWFEELQTVLKKRIKKYFIFRIDNANENMI